MKNGNKKMEQPKVMKSVDKSLGIKKQILFYSDLK